MARSNLSVYNIGGSNFFQLRELGTALGFTVDYDAATNTAIVLSTQQSNSGNWQPGVSSGSGQSTGGSSQTTPSGDSSDLYQGYGSYEGYLNHYREMYPKASEDWLRTNFPDPADSHPGAATAGDERAGLLG